MESGEEKGQLTGGIAETYTQLLTTGIRQRKKICL